MAAQVLGGISTVIAFSMGSLLAAAMGGTAFGGAGATLTTVGAALFALPLARLVVTHGRRRAMTTGMSIGLAGAVLAFLAAQLWFLPLLLVGFVLLGAATAVGLQARFAAADCATTNTRARYLSLVVWASTIGGVAGPNLLPVARTLSDTLGVEEHSGAYLICIAAQLLAVFVLLFGLPKTPGATAAATRTHTRVRLRPRARAIIASLAVAQLAMVAIMAMTPVHLHHHGSTLSLVGLTISLHVAGMYALAPVFGWVTDKTGALPVLVAGYLTIGVSCLILIAWSAHHMAVVVALILLGLGWSCAFVAASALLVATATDTTRAALQGRGDFMTNIAGATGGLLAGPVLSAWGMPILAGGVCVLVAVAGVLLTRSLRMPQST